ncbi:MAG: LamG-like jellyroll fold domain-containing protein, partial [Verrucomicrobiota bacterium]
TWKQDSANGFTSYLDGQLVTSRDSSTSPIPAHEASLFFGAFNGAGEFANGCLDEIAIWRRALSQPEIEANWNKILTGNEPGLEGYWTFDDGTVTDLSPNGHDGEIVGGASTRTADIPGLGGRVFTTTILGGPGDYQLENVPANNGYVLTAFLDNNGNGHRDPEEPVGIYEGNPFDVTEALTNIEINLQAAAFVTESPQSVSARAGETIHLSGTVSGSEPLTTQWLKNGEALGEDEVISGASTPNLTITGARPEDMGRYSLRVSNRVSEFTSEPATVSLTNVTPAEGLLLHWKFDEPAGTSVSDSSGNGFHGGLGSADGGQADRLADGIASGQAIRTEDAGGNGSGFALLSLEDERWPDLQSFSLSMWVNQDPEDPGVSTLFSKGIEGDPFALAAAGPDLFWFAGGVDAMTIPGAMTPGTTQHIAVTVDNLSDPSVTIIYIDGAEAGRLENAGLFIDSEPSAFQIGAQNNAFGFKGVIDDVQLYSAALEAAEIATLFENPGTALAEPVIEGVPGGDGDSDGDGASDRDEALAGTNPNNASSIFRVIAISPSTEGTTITWQSVEDKSYEIEYSTTLNGDWVNVGTQASMGTETNFTDTDAGRLASREGYYRISVE